MKYNKLIRDKIPEIIASKGGRSTVHVASEAEYRTKLREKLTEEVEEYLRDENREELADILEVVYALAELGGFGREQIEGLRQKKVEERGGFSQRLILEES